MAAHRQVYDSRHLQADYAVYQTQFWSTKNRDQLRNPTFGNRVLATFTFFTCDYLRYRRNNQSVIHLPTPLENAPH